MLIRALFPACLLLACLSPAVAEAETYKARSRVESFANPTQSGSSALRAIVWYPSLDDSRALAAGPKDGASVIVFLHGRSAFAAFYAALGRTLAEQGYVVVLSDTARSDPAQQRADGKALYAALEAANAEAGFWQGALDMSRVGLSGHSMGGGSTAHVLADNPGYAAGFAFAPWQGNKPFSDCARVRTPLGIVHGEGDRLLPWEATGKRLFEALPQSSSNFLYLMNDAATHTNIALRHPFSGNDGRRVFGAATELCLAFFNAHLRGSDAALSQLLGAQNRDSNLTKVYGQPQPARRPEGARLF